MSTLERADNAADDSLEAEAEAEDDKEAATDDSTMLVYASGMLTDAFPLGTGVT